VATQADYEQDFYAWAEQQAELLRAGRWSDLDVLHLSEELESMGAREKRELISRLAVLLSHLLKWQYQASRRGRSWELTITEQRGRILDLLADNPSLKQSDRLLPAIQKAYKYAVIRAELETGLSGNSFPRDCPYEWKDIMDEHFLPTGP
jgi:hypothetical protein